MTDKTKDRIWAVLTAAVFVSAIYVDLHYRKVPAQPITKVEPIYLPRADVPASASKDDQSCPIDVKKLRAAGATGKLHFYTEQEAQP
jgi:hypothetical protein